MIAEIRKEGDYWSLYVDGRKTVDQESFAVVDRVKYFLDHPARIDHSECFEIAENIREREAS